MEGKIIAQSPLIEQVRAAFSNRHLPANPSILQSKDHTEYPDVQKLFEVDWVNPLPQMLSKCANAVPLLTPKGFVFLFGKFLEVTLTNSREMLGNELTNVLLMDLLQPPDKFPDTIVSKKISDLSTAEVVATDNWSIWFEKSEFKQSISQIEEKAIWLRANISK